MINFEKVGKRITELRKKHNYSQETLASLLYVTRQCLSKWELGNAIPSVDVLLELCKIFSVSIDEMLCLDSESEIDKDNIFKGHNRMYIINKIMRNELDVNISDIFYQLSPSERMIVLKSVKDGNTKVDVKELKVKLTDIEKIFLGE